MTMATPLTPRERQVSDYLCRGFTNKETAGALGVSRRTVEDHRTSIFRKYEVRNAVELVRAVYGMDERDQIIGHLIGEEAAG